MIEMIQAHGSCSSDFLEFLSRALTDKATSGLSYRLCIQPEKNSLATNAFKPKCDLRQEVLPSLSSKSFCSVKRTVDVSTWKMRKVHFSFILLRTTALSPYKPTIESCSTLTATFSTIIVRSQVK